MTSDLNLSPGSKRIKVAAVQLRSAFGDVAGNLGRAADAVEQAVAEGARLAVLPEMYATGYDGTRRAWDVAEPVDGPIGQWVAATAGRLGVYLGCGMVERAGTDCYNAVVWAGPDGQISGTTRKSFAEWYVFRRGERGMPVIETSIGRVGAGICADNQLTAHLRLMAERRVDLVAMPHAAPMLAEPSRFGGEAEIAAQHERMKGLPVLYAKALGVPVIFANPVGLFGRISGIIGSGTARMGFRLLGLSRIVDSDGKVVAELGSEEGVAVADVVLDPARKVFVPPPDHHGGVYPTSAVLRRVVYPTDIGLGRLAYRLGTRERLRRFGRT